MAEDRTCLDCVAQYSHLPVKLCEAHADERRAGETRMNNHELYEKLQELLAHLADPFVALENVGQEQEFDQDRYYGLLIDEAIHAAANRRCNSTDEKLFWEALKACKLQY